LAKLGRRLQVAAPCTGIHGCGAAFDVMKVEADTHYIYDLEKGYKAFLQHHLQQAGMKAHQIQLNLGKICGDLLSMPLSKLKPPIDIICAGPPCPPWSGQGLKNSTKDPRAKVFLKILGWVVYAIKTCGLLACVLENVLGITFAHGGREPVIYWWLQVLRTCCPEFEWAVHTMALIKYMSPQTRVRVFLIGMRKSIGALPTPLPPFGRADIQSVLGKFPESRSQLCSNQKANLSQFEATINKMYEEGRLELEDVVCIGVDRAEAKEYKQNIVVNKLPTLTTNSGCLMVLSVSDVVHKVPYQDRLFCRHVRNTEKLLAQGFPKETHLHLNSSCAQKAAGNAYPRNLMVAVLHPVINCFSKFDLASWPPSSVLGTHQEGMNEVAKALAMLGKPTPKVGGRSAKSKATKAKARLAQTRVAQARRLKRKKRSSLW